MVATHSAFASPDLDHTQDASARQVSTLPKSQTREDRRMGGTSTPAQAVAPRVEFPIEAIKRINEMSAEIKHLEDKLAESQKREIVPLEAPVAVAMPVLDLSALVEVDQGMRAIISNFFIDGVHYGTMPGTTKKILFKIGAEWMLKFLGLYADYKPVETIRDFDRPLIFYEYRCELRKVSTGQIVAVAIGSCSSEEDKYKYRMEERTCPACGQATIRRSKYPNRDTGKKGWYCNKKAGGCGAQYEAGAIEIENQEVGRIINPDLTGLAHTISAMAQKRTFVLALRANTGVSAYFEEINMGDDNDRRDDTLVIENPRAGASLSPMAINNLIDFAITLLPTGKAYTRQDIAKSCLNALEMDSWNQAIIGTEDELKEKIRTAIEAKLPQASETAIKLEDEQSESSETPLCVGCRKNPAQGGESPFPNYCTDCGSKLADQAAAAEAKKKGAKKS